MKKGVNFGFVIGLIFGLIVIILIGMFIAQQKGWIDTSFFGEKGAVSSLKSLYSQEETGAIKTGKNPPSARGSVTVDEIRSISVLLQSCWARMKAKQTSFDSVLLCDSVIVSSKSSPISVQDLSTVLRRDLNDPAAANALEKNWAVTPPTGNLVPGATYYICARSDLYYDDLFIYSDVNFKTCARQSIPTVSGGGPIGAPPKY